VLCGCCGCASKIRAGYNHCSRRAFHDDNWFLFICVSLDQTPTPFKAARRSWSSVVVGAVVVPYSSNIGTGAGGGCGGADTWGSGLPRAGNASWSDANADISDDIPGMEGGG
jgi:hypothetical protein